MQQIFQKNYLPNQIVYSQKVIWKTICKGLKTEDVFYDFNFDFNYQCLFLYFSVLVSTKFIISDVEFGFKYLYICIFQFLISFIILMMFVFFNSLFVGVYNGFHRYLKLIFTYSQNRNFNQFVFKRRYPYSRGWGFLESHCSV